LFQILQSQVVTGPKANISQRKTRIGVGKLYSFEELPNVWERRTALNQFFYSPPNQWSARMWLFLDGYWSAVWHKCCCNFGDSSLMKMRNLRTAAGIAATYPTKFRE
jgi:hypothetical protein